MHLATVARLLSTFPEDQGRHSSCITLISMGCFYSEEPE